MTSSAYKKGDADLVIDKTILVKANEDGAKQCNFVTRDHALTTDTCARGLKTATNANEYYSIMAGIKPHGHDLGAEVTDKVDRNGCAKHCSDTATCVAFVWTPSGTKCQPKSKMLKDRYDPTWTNYATEVSIVADVNVEYGEIIQTYERDPKDTWDTYELLEGWTKPKWERPGECEHSTAASTVAGGEGVWFNICP
jgi:hypothetical protein